MMRTLTPVLQLRRNDSFYRIGNPDLGRPLRMWIKGRSMPPQVAGARDKICNQRSDRHDLYPCMAPARREITGRK